MTMDAVELPNPIKRYGFCLRCLHHNPENALKEINEKHPYQNMVRHVKWVEHSRNVGSSIKCNKCQMSFHSQANLKKHACTQAMEEGVQFNRFSMISEDYVMHRILREMPFPNLASICFEVNSKINTYLLMINDN